MGRPPMVRKPPAPLDFASKRHIIAECSEKLIPPAMLEAWRLVERSLRNSGGTAMRQRRYYFSILLTLAALLSRLARADSYDPPANYYNAATGTGATLKTQLHDIIDGHTTRTYDQLRADLQITDADPNDSSRIMPIYNNRESVAKVTNGMIPGWDGSNNAPWNREHSWPQSRGLNGDSPPDGSDMHHVFPAVPLANSTRNNFNFGGEFGQQGPGLLNDGGTKYYPGDLDAGMAARAQFYMATRYDGLQAGTTNLELVPNNPADGDSLLGDFNRLLEWHYAAVPDTFERNRNQIIYSNYQGNRNPFIDRPEFVWSIFVDQNNDSQISIAGSTVNANGSSARNVDLGRVFTGAAVPAPQVFTLNKSGTDGTYFQVSASGAATSSLSGRYNAMRMTNVNQIDTKAISVGLTTSTATAGLKSGTVTIDNLDITTGGGSGHGAGDANDTFNVSLTVLDHATPSFASPGLTTTLNHDFGNVALGAGASPFNFSVHNLLATAGYTANMDFDSITPSGNTSAFTTNLASFAGSLVLAGGASQAFTSSFVASTVGTFSASYLLNFSDENIAGALNKSITLSLTGKMRLAGDYNGDLVVDAADYVVWRNQTGQPVAPYSSADGDGNGTINELDYNVWRTHFGQAASGSGAALATAEVPEPCFLAMFVSVALVGGARRRSR